MGEAVVICTPHSDGSITLYPGSNDEAYLIRTLVSIMRDGGRIRAKSKRKGMEIAELVFDGDTKHRQKVKQ